MSVKQVHYDLWLAEFSGREQAIALLKHHRPYLEMLPSMRRPEESVLTIPLPVARIKPKHSQTKMTEGTQILPCDIAVLMCDPEWKIKIGAEIMIFIHRPQEDFGELLLRWRQTQVYLDQEYEWLMPLGQEHIFSEMAEQIYPLFVIFGETPERIKKGLLGAGLPFVIQTQMLMCEEESNTVLSSEC